MNKTDAEKYLNYIEIEDLPEFFQPIANKLGMENFIYLIDELRGISVYFPKMEKVVHKARARLIYKECFQYNFSELAKRHDLSEVWVRELIKTEQAKQKNTDEERKSS